MQYRLLSVVSCCLVLGQRMNRGQNTLLADIRPPRVCITVPSYVVVLVLFLTSLPIPMSSLKSNLRTIPETDKKMNSNIVKHRPFCIIIYGHSAGELQRVKFYVLLKW
jgi:hypothetical protein